MEKTRTQTKSENLFQPDTKINKVKRMTQYDDTDSCNNWDEDNYDPYLDYLINPQPMGKYLQEMGFRIPKRLVEETRQNQGFNRWQKVQLIFPTRLHDIYSENTFSEFKQIIRRLHVLNDPNNNLCGNQNQNLQSKMNTIQLDYRAIKHGVKPHNA